MVVLVLVVDVVVVVVIAVEDSSVIAPKYVTNIVSIVEVSP